MTLVYIFSPCRYDPSSTEKDENNYDRLLPTADCERLCTFTYGRVSPAAMRTEEGCDSHLATLHMYVLVTLALKVYRLVQTKSCLPL